jgi:hypothetical protein
VFGVITVWCEAKLLLQPLKSYKVENGDENIPVSLVKHKSSLEIDGHGRRISSIDLEGLVELDTLLAIVAKEGPLEIQVLTCSNQRECVRFRLQD